MSTLILLTTEPENWAPKEIVKVAEKKGFEVTVINPDNCFIVLDDKPYVMHDGKKIETADLVIPRMSEDNLEYKCAIMSHLETSGIPTLNCGKSMQIASNKVETQILLHDAGLNTPRSVLFTNEEQVEAAVAALDEKFPMIVKTLYGTHGVGVIRADSKASLISIVQQLLKSGEQFMLQEFIEHDKSARVLLLDKKVVAAVMRSIPEGDFRSNAHQGAELTEHVTSEAEVEACVKAAAAIGINFAAVDYILDGDKIVLLEVNGSPGFESMQKVVSVNVAETLIDYCLDRLKATSSDEPIEAPSDDTIVSAEVEDATSSVEVTTTASDDNSTEVVVIPPHDVAGDKIVGTLTNVVIKHFNNEEPIEARIDTGANTSSIHGENIEINNNSIRFKFGKTTYRFHLYRTTNVKQASDEEADERPVIRVDMVLDGFLLRNVELTVTDREHMEYNILLGRKVLSAGGFLVNPAAGVLDGVNVDPNAETPLVVKPGEELEKITQQEEE